MNSCTHCMGVKKNEIGETVALCEHSGRWENVTLGNCFGNCDGQEYSKDYIAQRLRQMTASANWWRIDDTVLGMDAMEFDQILTVAADMIMGETAK